MSNLFACTPGETIVLVQRRGLRPLLGIYVAHDEQHLKLRRDGEVMQIPVGDIRHWERKTLGWLLNQAASAIR